jgi:RNA polymerase sigma-70 factor (ECF subfamily)
VAFDRLGGGARHSTLDELQDRVVRQARASTVRRTIHVVIFAQTGDEGKVSPEGAFSRTFLQFAPPACRPQLAAVPALEDALRALVRAGSEAWPQLALRPAQFVGYLAERMPDDRDGAEVLATIHAADLYLACGCALGDPIALAAFEQHFLSQVSAYLSRADALPAFADEVKQVLRHRLLVGQHEIAPKIASYSGRGPLGAWLRMIAARTAVDLRRTQKPGVPLEDGPQLAASSLNPELQYLKTRYSKEFARAFERTLAELPAKEASVLRLYFLEGMTADAIGVTYRVSGRTVQRWIAESRQNILREMRRLLRQALAIDERELESLFELVRSQLDVSLRRHLRRSAQ